MINAESKTQQGMAAILTIVIIGAASLIIAKSLVGLGISDLDISAHDLKGSRALALADNCLEEVLRRLQIDNNFTANDLDLEFGDGNCTVNILADNGHRIVNIAGIIDNYRKNIRAEAEISENHIILLNWEETY